MSDEIKQALDTLVKNRVKQLEEKNKRLEEQHRLLLSNIPVLLSFVKHSRNSCSDNSPVNSYADHGEAMCSRCVLLEMQKSNWNDEWVVEINLKSEPVTKIDATKIRQRISNAM